MARRAAVTFLHSVRGRFVLLRFVPDVLCGALEGDSRSMQLLGDMLSPATLPAAELHAACLDGELLTCGSAYVCVDAPDTPLLRAMIASAECGDDIILERLTAAWVHGATRDPPPMTFACISVAERIRAPLRAGLCIREVRIRQEEIVRKGRVRVTSPMRTVCDLARVVDDVEFSGVHNPLRALCALFGFSAADVVQALLVTRNLPFRGRAIGRVLDVLSQR